jgi:S1-C subfamily serine protease
MRLTHILRFGIVAIAVSVITLGGISGSKAGSNVAPTSTPCPTSAARAATAAATSKATSAPTVESSSSEDRPGFLGIEAGTWTCGILIRKVYDGSPAWKAGLYAGEVIVAVDGITVSDLASDANLATPQGDYSDPLIYAFFAKMETYHAGDTITLTVTQDGNTKDVQVTLIPLAKLDVTAAATSAK